MSDRAAARRLVRPQLVVGDDHESLDRDADTTADAVMRRLSGLAEATFDNEDPPVRRALDTGGDGVVGAAGGDVDLGTERAIFASRGAPLDDTTRTSMESAFGADFRSVRVHTGPSADVLNQRMSAQAFTTGSDIFVRSGDYSPRTEAGQRLLAHELTHVVQQNGSSDAHRIRRHASWEHKMLGDVTPDDLVILGAGRDILADGGDQVTIDIGGQQQVVTKDEVLHVLEQEIARLKIFRDHPPAAATPAAEAELARLDLEGRQDRAGAKAKAGVEKDYGVTIRPSARAQRRQAIGTAVQLARAAELNTHWQVKLIGVPHPNENKETVVTYGELNTLGDFVGNPQQLSQMSAKNLYKIVQGIRQESLLKFMRLEDEIKGRWKITKFLTQDKLGSGFDDAAGNVGRGDLSGEVRLMKGGKTTVGGREETGYSAGLARNACHFAPFSWHAWAKYHLGARTLAQESYDAAREAERLDGLAVQADGDAKEALTAQADEKRKEAADKRTQAIVENGYGDHFLQDSYAAGHLINKEQIMIWYTDYVKNTWHALDYMKDATLNRIAQVALNQQGLGATAAVHDRDTVGVSQPKDIQSVENTDLGYVESFQALGLQTPPSVTPGNTNAFKFTYAWQRMALGNQKAYRTLTPAKAVTMVLAAKVGDAGIPTLQANECDVLMRDMVAQGVAKQKKSLLGGTSFTLEKAYMPRNKAYLFAWKVGDIIAGGPVAAGAKADYEKSATQVTYKAYHEFINSGVVQTASNILHDEFCANGLDVASAQDGEVFRVYGDNAMLERGSSQGLKHSATTANMSRDTIYGILNGGGGDPAVTAFGTIRDRLPNHVRWENVTIGLDQWHTNPQKLKKFCEDGIFAKANRSIKTKAAGMTGGDLAKYVSKHQRVHGGEAF